MRWRLCSKACNYTKGEEICVKEKTILLLASYYGPYGGNFVASLLAFNNSIKEQGGKIIYIFPKDVEGYSWVPQVRSVADKVYFIPYKPYSRDNIERIKKIVQDEKTDIVFSRMGGWDITACLAAGKIPVIWLLEYALVVNGIKKHLKYLVKYRIIGRNVINLAVSDASAKQVNLYNPKHECQSIPNALDLSRLCTKSEMRNTDGICNILIFAYDPWIKGLDIALDAVEKLNTEKLKYRLLISAQERTHYYLKERYSEIPEWIQVLQPTNDISSVYAQADIMLSASRHEGFSYCLAEAIYTGLPVIYSDIPGTSWADAFKACYQFKSGDADSLVDAIECCSSLRITKIDFEENRKLMTQKYSMDTWCEHVLEAVNVALE